MQFGWCGVKCGFHQKIIDNLKENDSINWVFLEDSHEAISQVESGECYAALVIDQDFSEDMLSFLGGNVKHPTIIYYENEKKNAIAPKITGKVKTTVQEEVNKAFVNTMASSLLTASNYVITEDGNASNGITGVAVTKLNRLNSDVLTIISLLDSYISIMDASESLMEAAAGVSTELDAIEENSRAMMAAADSSLSVNVTSVGAVSQVVIAGFDTADQQLENTQILVNEMISQVEKTGEYSETMAEALNVAVTSTQNSFDTAVSTIRADVNYQNDTLDAKIDEVNNMLSSLNTNMSSLQTAGGDTAEDAAATLKDLSNHISNARTSLAALKSGYQNSVSPSINNTLTQIGNSLNEVRSLLKYSGSGVDQLAGILGSYPDVMSMGKDNLVETRNSVAEMQAELQQIINDMEAVDENEQYQMLLQLLYQAPLISINKTFTKLRITVPQRLRFTLFYPFGWERLFW